MLLVGWLVAAADPAVGSTAQQDLILTLSNPVSNLARISANFDADRDIGEDKQGSLHVFRLHPILPFDLDGHLRLISDTVLSANSERLAETEWIRDTVIQETLSLVPAQTYSNGFLWAAGAAVRYADNGGKWGVGPSISLLQEDHNEVSGFTLVHLWSASEDHGDLSTLDAFTTWTHKDTGITLRAQATYDERTREMLAPVGFELRRIFNTVSFGVAVDLRARYYLEVPRNSGRWGGGIGLTFTHRLPE